VAVLSVSSSAPLIAYAARRPGHRVLAQCALALGVLGPAAAVTGRAQLRRLVTTDRRTLVGRARSPDWRWPCTSAPG
jgi:hypothetical protein